MTSCRLDRIIVSLLFSLLPALALAQGASSDIDFATAEVKIHSERHAAQLSVELAMNGRQRARGLMERESLDADAGMLFLYERERTPGTGFWMYRTRIPLDIAFIGSDGRIAAIQAMPPCDADAPGGCPTYEAGVTYVAALEVNAGYFDENDIDIGDCVALDGERLGRASDC